MFELSRLIERSKIPYWTTDDKGKRVLFQYDPEAIQYWEMMLKNMIEEDIRLHPDKLRGFGGDGFNELLPEIKGEEDMKRYKEVKDKEQHEAINLTPGTNTAGTITKIGETSKGTPFCLLKDDNGVERILYKQQTILQKKMSQTKVGDSVKITRLEDGFSESRRTPYFQYKVEVEVDEVEPDAQLPASETEEKPSDGYEPPTEPTTSPIETCQNYMADNTCYLHHDCTRCIDTDQVCPDYRGTTKESN
jgi:hypothetical protein